MFLRFLSQNNKFKKNVCIYRRVVRRKANFLTWTNKSQFCPKKAIVWAHFWPFSGSIGFSSSGSSKLAFLRTARRYVRNQIFNLKLIKFWSQMDDLNSYFDKIKILEKFVIQK